MLRQENIHTNEVRHATDALRGKFIFDDRKDRKERNECCATFHTAGCLAVKNDDNANEDLDGRSMEEREEPDAEEDGLRCWTMPPEEDGKGEGVPGLVGGLCI
ncbi:uncharacterized protein [Apostichopus japonicus]|uniref:uncharacterized protein n=1 Tax=Stichopus japonicus TaxID=307972 RepID=UPI003AB7658B